MIQIITKLDETLSYILNMNWLYVPFQLQLKNLTHMISQKISKQVFHSNEHK